MLGTVLEKLESLLSKSFLIASFFPILIFSALNGAMLYWISQPAREWLAWYHQQDAASKGVYGATVLIGLAVAAYVFSTLSLVLRNALEGRYFQDSRLGQLLEGRQRARLRQFEEEFDRARTSRRSVRREAPDWERRLREAREQGEAVAQNAYPGANEPAAATLRELGERRDCGEMIGPEALRDAVGQLEPALRQHAASRPNEQGRNQLDADHRELVALIRYAGDKYQNLYLRLFNEKQFNYPATGLAPTRIGNIAASVRSYADSRYGLDLDVFWSRLQKAIQGDAKFYGVLQDAKTQLDFLVALLWLTVGSTVIWLVVLPFASYAYLPFVTVWVAGPVLTALWYVLAIQNYRAFADLLRSAVDLFRWDLLTALHLPLPVEAGDERRLWTALRDRTGFGEDVNLVYARPVK